MQHSITPRSPLEPALIPRLPGDILYLVAYFSSFETRATLVRCNKWLHETCTPLLFKDIYLHAPMQLINLYANDKAMGMLNRTNSIYLGERLFAYCPNSWPEQVFEIAPILIVLVLSSTTSLSRLQIYSSDRELEPNDDIYRYANFTKILASAASDPGFLPNLAIIIELPRHIKLDDLCHGRPVIYYYHQIDHYVHADFYPGLEKGELRTHLNLSAHDVGTLIGESECTSLNLYGGGYISIRMRFPVEIDKDHHPVDDPLSWTYAMLSASRTSYDDLYALDITFEPNPPYHSAAIQFAAVEELYEIFPELEDISIFYPQLDWSRSVDHCGYESKYFPDDSLPVWTPCPMENLMPHWMDWWLHALHLDSQKPQSPEEIIQIAVKLMDGIFLRWDNNCAPSHEAVLQYLTSVKYRPY